MADFGYLTERLSPSSIDLMLRCEAAYFFRYIEGIRKPPDGSMAAGRAFDATTVQYYLDRLAFDEKMSASDVQEFFAARFDAEAQQVEDWHDDRGMLLDRGVNVAAEWKRRCGDFVRPISLQEKVTATVSDVPDAADLNAELGISPTFDLRGYIDTLGDVPNRGPTVIDHKLSNRAWRTSEVLKGTQPVVYRLGTGIASFQYHVGRRDTQRPQVQVLSRTVSDGAVRSLIKISGIVRRRVVIALRTGDWLPNRGNALCSRRWCAYWDRCEKRYGGTVPH